ncbi:PEBP-like protein [Aspergillus heteromorphus CBS 117.55]|uniref:PEBP-like protein n=1 Tax=Aspergillus heteromorphus CBS 117.55 TaxID=1448321 RepID=A0A317VQC6_9EURO|nr:PEBP-like protein [Aspergillus heteromorphus CBS 117.55]PWY75092.1 PEBP-like protein [Aspergillus heteromorphus CBS 117.55]
MPLLTTHPYHTLTSNHHRYPTYHQANQSSKLFTNRPAFLDHPYPTIPITCTELGPFGAYLDADHTQDGAGYFPALSWPSPSPETQEYLLVSEDPDAPYPESVIHGIYYGIPRVFTGLQHLDFEVDEESFREGGNLLRGGFWFGMNRRGTVYLPPAGERVKGLHRYFFELVALNESIGLGGEEMGELPTVEEIEGKVEGKVAAWGAWMGVTE